jgi:hypothetical protein
LVLCSYYIFLFRSYLFLLFHGFVLFFYW